METLKKYKQPKLKLIENYFCKWDFHQNLYILNPGFSIEKYVSSQFADRQYVAMTSQQKEYQAREN